MLRGCLENTFSLVYNKNAETLPVASTGNSATANNYYKGAKFPFAEAKRMRHPPV